MALHRFPLSTNEIRENNGSHEFTIPKPIARELELEAGQVPETVLWDDEDGGKLVLEFAQDTGADHPHSGNSAEAHPL